MPALLARGGTYPAKAAVTRAGRWDLLPNGARVKGANIMPPTRAGATDGLTRLADMWARWSDASHPGGWLNIKAQIDQLKTLGGNTFRVFATQNGRAGSGSSYPDPVSDAAYFAAWDQLANYCRTQGMFLYPCLGGQDSAMIDGGNGWPFTPTLAWQLAESVKIARYLERHIDVIPGIDLANESVTWATTSENGRSRAIQVYEAVKAAAPRFLYTWSNTAFATPGGTVAIPAGSYDFLDYHIYYNATATDFDAILAVVSAPVMIGEFGLNRSVGAAARQARYNAALGVVNNIGNSGTGFRKVAGAMVWTLRDAGPGDPSDQTIQWGLADITGATVYSDVSTIWGSFPTA